MVRKKTPRVRRLAALCAVFLVCAVAMFPCFAFAAVQPPFGAEDEYELVYNPLQMDTFVIDPFALDVSLASPFYHGITQDGYQLEEYDTLEIMFQEPNGAGPESQILSVVPNDNIQALPGSSAFYRGFTIECDVFSNNYVPFGFTNSTAFISDWNMLNVMSNSLIRIDPNCTYTRTVHITGRYPIPDPQVPNAYTFEPFTESLEYVVTNTGNSQVNYALFPQMNEYSYINDVIGPNKRFIIDSYYVLIEITAPVSSVIGAISFGLPYVLPSSLPDVAQFAIDYGTTINVYPGQPGDSSFQLGEFLRNTVGNFLDVEIAPGVSLAGIFASVLGILLFFAFLKIFAGG